MLCRLMTFLTAGCVLLATDMGVAAEPIPFRYSSDIETGSLDEEELVDVPFDSDIFGASRDDFPDVRIRDQEGRDVPYLVDKVIETRTESTQQRWPARDVSLKPIEGGGAETLIRRNDQEPAVDGIRLMTPLRNYEQRVQVFGSNDGTTWEPLVRDGLVFDYSRYMDVSNNEIPLPKNAFLRFRIVIDDVTAEQESELLELTRRLRGDVPEVRSERVVIDRRPFRIDRIEFWHNITKEQFKGDKHTDYPIADSRVEENVETQESTIYVHTQRQPLTGFRILTASRNFSRSAKVQVPVTQGANTEYRTVGTATISRIQFRQLDREELRITFPETRSSDYRIVIENRDSPVLEITGIEAEGTVYQATFLASPGESYRILYGSETAESPSYDTTAIQASLKQGYVPLVARLGQPHTNPLAEKASGWSMSKLINNTLVLGAVVCLLVALLGWGLYAAARRVDDLPKT